MVNYVSFASSIASILLAVTAIIYGFIQSDGQQKSAGMLAIQVDEIRQASSKMTASRESLETQLDRFSVVASKIDELSNMVGGRFSSMEGNFAELRREVAAKAKVTPAVPPAVTQRGAAEKTRIAQALLSSTTWNADLLTYSLYLWAKDGLPPMKFIDFLSAYYAKPLSTTKEGDSYSEYLAVGLQILTSLRAMGLLEASASEAMSFSEEVRSYVLERGPSLEVKPHDFIAEGLVAIRKAFESTR